MILLKRQAQKLCKLSLEIDSRIRAGDKDVDKFLSSYDKLVKTDIEVSPEKLYSALFFNSYYFFMDIIFFLE